MHSCNASSFLRLCIFQGPVDLLSCSVAHVSSGLYWCTGIWFLHWMKHHRFLFFVGPLMCNVGREKTSQNNTLLLKTSVPSKFSPSVKMPVIMQTFWTQSKNAENFLIIFVQFQCDLQKKRSSRWWRHLFLRFYVDLQKKKKKKVLCRVLQLFSAISATYQSEVLWIAAVYGFWRKKKRRNSQNCSAKMLEKISHFFALIGNTAQTYCKKSFFNPNQKTNFADALIVLILRTSTSGVGKFLNQWATISPNKVPTGRHHSSKPKRKVFAKFRPFLDKSMAKTKK